MLTHDIGMLSPPAWFNYCAHELESVLPGSLRVMNAQLRLSDDFQYHLEEIRAAASEVKQAAKCIADSQVEMAVQIGTPFSTVHGWDNGCALEQSIQDHIGMPFEMMGLSLVRLCHELNIETLTVCTVYYTAHWSQSYKAFLSEAGLRALFAGSFSELGTMQQTTKLESCDAHELCTKETMIESVNRCCEQAPHADAVLFSGIPCAHLDMIVDLEAAAGRPVITYPAVYVRVLKALGLTCDPALGRMFSTLSTSKGS